MKFLFGTKAAGEGCVPAALLYEPGKCTYGFLTEENRKTYARLGIPELNDGFDAVYWAQGALKVRVEADENGCFAVGSGADCFAGVALPLTFACEVPSEGNYRVRVTLFAETEAQALIFLGRRRLAARVALKEGEGWSGSFVTNICPVIPRTYETAMEDLTLDVTLLGGGVRLCAVEAERVFVPTLYIAGDSTVTDQSADYPYLPGSSYCGWGQMLSAYLGDRIAVSNHSHSGLTTESFRSEGHYALLLERIGAGDICLFQFGHNDQKLMHLLAEGGYRENLLRYICEIREKGAAPVLVTPLARNSWMGGSGAYNDLLDGYARACMELGKEQGVPVLDLHGKSLAFVKRQGREAAKRFFFPSDYTHSNDYGAYLFAGYIYEELCEKNVLSQAGLLRTDGAVQQAWEPPEVLPVLTVPEEFSDMENPAAEHLFEDLERREDVLTRAEALELIITAMHFFPTNVYNDMFTDVIGHETYAGTVECAWQNGLIPPELIENNTLQPLLEVDGGTFLHMLLNGYATRKDLPQGGGDLEKAAALGVVERGFDMDAPLTRGAAAEMCRRLKI